MNETRRQAGSLHDRERFLSGTVTNSTNPTRSTPTTTTPRLYAITHRVVIAARLESQLPSTIPSTSFHAPARRGISKKESKNREEYSILHDFLLVDHDFCSQICSPGCIISNGVTVRSKDRKNSIKIGKFERINFLEIRKIFRKVSDENAQSSLFVEGI